jgi:hypothetical protein
MAGLDFFKGNVMKKTLYLLVFAIISSFSMLVNAASVSIKNPAPAPSTHSFTVNFGTIVFSYMSPTDVDKITVVDQIKGSGGQSYDNIGDEIETAFGLAANTFDDESVVDDTYSTYKGDISGSMTTITSDLPFDYLSIHFGGYNAFFQFASLTNSLKINVVSATKGGGLSNYRAYNSGISPVPVPAAAFLFAPALLGFIALSRRSKKA